MYQECKNLENLGIWEFVAFLFKKFKRSQSISGPQSLNLFPTMLDTFKMKKKKKMFLNAFYMHSGCALNIETMQI